MSEKPSQLLFYLYEQKVRARACVLASQLAVKLPPVRMRDTLTCTSVSAC